MPQALPAGGSTSLLPFSHTLTDKLALVLKNTTTNQRHLDNQEMTAALLFTKISLYPSHKYTLLPLFLTLIAQPHTPHPVCVSVCVCSLNLSQVVVFPKE